MGATLGGAFGLLVNAVHPMADASIPTFAIVGMAAMVGGGTGAAMTAVTMIFEMTRDYGLVMPMIVAVALSIGVRRVLSRENIYTIKLVERRHMIPEGDACEHVPGASRQRDHGQGRPGVAGGDRLRFLSPPTRASKAR